jgi:hypothetical protein
MRCLSYLAKTSSCVLVNFVVFFASRHQSEVSGKPSKMAQQAVIFTSSSKEVQCWPEGGSILLLCHHFLSGALQRTAHQLCRVRAPVLQRPQLRQHRFDELRVIRPTKNLQYHFRVLSLVYSRLPPVEFLDTACIYTSRVDNCEVHLEVNCYLLALLLSQSTSENAHEYRRSYFTRYPRHIEFLVASVTQLQGLTKHSCVLICASYPITNRRFTIKNTFLHPWRKE